MKRLIAILCLVALPLYAAEPALPDAADEARAQRLGYEIRCVVCQSESINDSQADMARDLRGVIRDKIRDGLSDGDIRDYLRARYGDFILLKPPLQPNTFLLWFFPLMALAAAVFLAAGYARKHRKTPDKGGKG